MPRGVELAFTYPVRLELSLIDIDVRPPDGSSHSWRRRSSRFRSAGDRGALPDLRDVGDHVAGAARRPRRPQAGAAAHPVRDVPRPAPDLRRPAAQVRQDRRRGDGQLPPARRRRRSTTRWSGMAQDWVLRVPLVHGAGQLRLRRRRPAGRLPLHRGEAHAARRDAAERTAISETVDMRPNYDGTRRGAGRPAGAVPEPARQRHRPASPSAWRRTSRRTTSARCCRACVLLIDNPDATIGQSAGARSRGRTSRSAARSSPTARRSARSTRRARGTIKVQGEWK